MKFMLREMLIDDYDAVLALWRAIPGFEYRPVTDSRAGIQRFLIRNPGLSLVAVVDEQIVGCILGSHDGRRGFLQHVVVAPGARGQGLARSMVDACLQRLRQEQLQWVLLNVSVGNDEALSFWKRRDGSNEHASCHWRWNSSLNRPILAIPCPIASDHRYGEPHGY